MQHLTELNDKILKQLPVHDTSMPISHKLEMKKYT